LRKSSRARRHVVGKLLTIPDEVTIAGKRIVIRDLLDADIRVIKNQPHPRFEGGYVAPEPVAREYMTRIRDMALAS